MNILFRSKPCEQTLLAIGSLLGISLSAQADPVVFNGYGVTYWTAQSSGRYDIVAYGAAGGSEHHYLGSSGQGGSGAMVEGDFIIDSGVTLTLVLGEKGGDGPYTLFGSAGGGGATAVYASANNPLLIAGGGGGAGANAGADGVSASSYSASDGVSSSGTAGSNGAGGSGGTIDNFQGSDSGSGGGGLNSPGGNGKGPGRAGIGGAILGPNTSSVSGTDGGGLGGFDGGGSGGGDAASGGGGGGGYSGGEGGSSTTDTGGTGGGAGGSLNNSGLYQNFETNTITSEGRVTIDELTGLGAPTPVPEPANYWLSAVGMLSFFGLSRLRRR